MWRFEKTKAILQNASWTLEIDVESPDAGLGGLDVTGPRAEQAPFSSRLGARLLQIQSPDPDSIGRPVCESVYVRGADLVVSYRMSKTPAICWQVYWRELACDENAIGGIELILSVETDLLDSDPRLWVGSRVPAVELLQIEPGKVPPARAIDIGRGGKKMGLAPSRHRENTEDSVHGEVPVPISLQPGSTENSAAQFLEPPGVLLVRPPQVSFSYLELIHPADFSALTVSSDGADPPVLVSRFHLFDQHLEKGVIRRGRLRGLVLPRADDIALATACYHSFLQSAVPLTA
jgi:hypothetical protein